MNFVCQVNVHASRASPSTVHSVHVSSPVMRACCRWRSSGVGCSSATSSSSSLSSTSSSALGLAPGTYALSRLLQRSTWVTCQLAARLPYKESCHDPHRQKRVCPCRHPSKTCHIISGMNIGATPSFAHTVSQMNSSPVKESASRSPGLCPEAAPRTPLHGRGWELLGLLLPGLECGCCLRGRGRGRLPAPVWRHSRRWRRLPRAIAQQLCRIAAQHDVVILTLQQSKKPVTCSA